MTAEIIVLEHIRFMLAELSRLGQTMSTSQPKSICLYINTKSNLKLKADIPASSFD